MDADEMMRRFDRLENLLLLIADALSADEDDEGEPELSLDGHLLPGERDQEAPL